MSRVGYPTASEIAQTFISQLGSGLRDVLIQLRGVIRGIASAKRFNALQDRDRRFPDRGLFFPPEHVGTVVFDRHYLYHTAWASRIIMRLKPELHIDVGSSLYFCGLLSHSIPMHHLDIRTVDFHVSGLQIIRGTIESLPYPDASLESISCLHVIEHVGLGRYGDPLGPTKDIDAVSELKRVLRPGGMLLLVVPVGKPRLVFNAHRIYSVETIVDMCIGLVLVEFALIPDNPNDGGLVISPSTELIDSQRYGCGCFLFQKTDAMQTHPFS